MHFPPRRALIAVVLVLFSLLATGPAAASSDRPAGSLDHSFSGNGKALLDFFPAGCHSHHLDCEDYAHSMAIDSRGRIIVGGFTPDTPPGDQRSAEIARLKPNGKLDPSFANGGTKRFYGAGAGSIAIDSEDRIVLSPSVYGEDAGVIRLDADGSFDDSFSGDGRAGNFGDAVAVEKDDSVIAPGDFYSSGTGDSGLRVLHFEPNGEVDPNFDSQVVPFEDFPVDDVAIDSKGRIVVESYKYLVRLLPGGAPDPGFGDDGVVVRPDSRSEGYGCSCSSIAIDSRDRIITGGRNVVHRYLPDGSLDKSFSGDGKIRTGHGEAGDENRLRGFEGAAVAVDDEDRVLISGAPGSVGRVKHGRSAMLARYRKNGRPDHSFGRDGKVRVSTDVNAQAGPYAVAPDPRGRIVTLGQGESPSKKRGLDFAVARYLGG